MNKFLVFCALTLGAAVAAPATAHTSPPDLSGTYVIDRSASDDPARAIEKAMSSMRRFKRNAVKRRLQDGMKAADTLRITQRGDSVMLQPSGRRRVTIVAGEAKSRTGQRGGTAEMEGDWQGDTFVVRTTSERFSREVRYSLGSDGSRMRIAVTMRAERLSQPIGYVLLYRRVEDAAASE